jgi:7,8-dihydropterin-6-yl-methyl-4-(beta-D-ribofuranosyl)aminobenzene 5'-phosphate synthase
MSEGISGHFQGGGGLNIFTRSWRPAGRPRGVVVIVPDLANRVRPRVVAPGHCTGWRAKAALAHTFAPGRYGPSVVGSLYALRAT